ncbi:hypothetical protein N7491_006342 [Penicillium cf. griseofulvum]|uniref:Semialdehyde dehydrogenase NAD-binding domain-containing protein n=1 Tax=Penicillium cf. griseofulvum TaxID=2972120 RepID=A0A9W9IXK9_9EURO|nr:hypothetical protein N7472_010627 [Penicillium cf. griseofulvum]KAJ5429326.1 hypothetical protein N7491_006342 [Penicillium cf. griseofulvum]KAJ5436896.1 hypothetical protein N7445_007781 [Penicillium cf. griseofulvum]
MAPTKVFLYIFSISNFSAANNKRWTTFSTGVTGYIGGDFLYAIHQAHPDWEYSILIRSKDKGAQVASQYPSARIVYGDLDSLDIIEEEVKNADIVYHTADCDHVACAKPIAKALAHHTLATPSG